MGVSLTSKNSSYDFDMGYGGFFNLRKNIALCLDEDFGNNYSMLSKCITPSDFAANDAVANRLIEDKNLDTDIIDFLYSPDTGGSISYKVCKKLYNLIKDVDFSDKTFRYAAYSHNDYEEFKQFLKECYTRRHVMKWY